MDTHVSLRIAGLDDAEMLTKLSVTTFVDAFGPPNTKQNMDKYLADCMNLETITADLKNTSGHFVLAENGNKAIGYARLRTSGELPEEFKNKKAIEIERIYVLAAYQNKKIGDMLINYCTDYAVKNNFDTLWLGVWEHNPHAIRFYQRKGFELFGSHPFLLGDDMQTDVLMKKELK